MTDHNDDDGNGYTVVNHTNMTEAEGREYTFDRAIELMQNSRGDAKCNSLLVFVGREDGGTLITNLDPYDRMHLLHEIAEKTMAELINIATDNNIDKKDMN